MSIPSTLKFSALAGAMVSAALLAGCQSRDTASSALPPPAQVNMQRLLNADQEGGQWMSHSRTYDEQYFSPLNQINDTNIADLGLAWFVDLPTNQNIETTPLMIDGVVYITLPWSKVMALDAKTGKQLWLYDPKVAGAWNINICCGVDNRGVAAWNGRIIFGTLDGRLISLDAKTGEPVWSVKSTPDERRYSITGAPRIANGKIFVGSAGAEFDVRGYVDAYDVETGERLWRFWTVPGDPAAGFENKTMEMAAATWKTPGWWNTGGGATVWDAITYDAVNDLVIFGTGNGTPGDAVRRDAGQGDNLFVTSIVAVHAEDGSYAWHYQPTPWETWDYDTDQQLMLLDIDIDGQKRHVVSQASKNGFFYHFDAATGKLLSAVPFTDVNWATGVDLATGRPNVVPESRPNLTGKVFNLTPGPAGAHAWQSMSYSPLTGLVYIPATTHWQLIGPLDQRQKYLADHPDTKQTFTGRLTAWDPVAQREVWRSEEFINPAGGVQVTGGALATAGNLVFHGNLPKREFAAYRATDGERLWSFDTKTAVLAGGISYQVDGDQYVAVAVGGPMPGGYYAPNGARLLVFKLGGNTVLPDIPPFTEAPLSTAAQFADAATITRGAAVFEAQCQLCHGRNGAARSTFPDLRRSPALTSQESLDTIVLQGALSERGMGSFREYLQDGDTVALRAYLISLAEAARAQAAGSATPAR
ncbi:MAG: PQQ-dependent dehydrogenase, methanol/ethanol family [Nevskiaceae bacterium]|jgi:PQQ-dependent dehydrogenase (methanol/ethanol family)|nr:PQQ-dependent dehydrogenase, methanol/ethanol family [Nevskiaceae bacterium]